MKKNWLLLILPTAFLIGVFIFSFKEKTIKDTPPGPHGGKLLVHQNITVEILTDEHSELNHLNAYVYKDSKLINPQLAKLVVTLTRFNDDVMQIEFDPVNDHLQSRQLVAEPHSFKVDANLKLSNQDFKWHYESIEGRVTLSEEVIQSAGIKSVEVGPANIEKKLTVIGKIAPNGDSLTSIYPRFAGMVKEMKKNLGDSVEKGEVIAVIESNESLHNYPITSPITGTVVRKDVVMGEMIKEDKVIYQIVDLKTVWADLTLYRKEAFLIKKGMPTLVAGDNGKPQQTSIINYISPLGIEDSQTILARTVLENTAQEWVPGMYVNASITYLSKAVPVAIEVSAVQRWHDLNVVFIQKGNTFQVTPIKLGEKNDQKIEVISGLKPGQAYVVENSFLLKAELEKAEAGHEH